MFCSVPPVPGFSDGVLFFWGGGASHPGKVTTALRGPEADPELTDAPGASP